jgi:hypothetical protein
MTISFGGSFFFYSNSQGFEPYSSSSAGNSLSFMEPDSIYVYANEYELFEVFGEVKFKAGNTPISLFGDYVNNTAADSLNDGWLAGIKLGKVGKPGSWDAKFIYRELKKDAVVGIFTDSDFIGGGTDGKGYEFGGSYQLADKVTLAATYFINELGFEDSKDFSRLMVDAKFKF